MTDENFTEPGSNTAPQPVPVSKPVPKSLDRPSASVDLYKKLNVMKLWLIIITMLSFFLLLLSLVTVMLVAQQNRIDRSDNYWRHVPNNCLANQYQQNGSNFAPSAMRRDCIQPTVQPLQPYQSDSPIPQASPSSGGLMTPMTR